MGHLKAVESFKFSTTAERQETLSDGTQNINKITFVVSSWKRWEHFAGNVLVFMAVKGALITDGLSRPAQICRISAHQISLNILRTKSQTLL